MIEGVEHGEEQGILDLRRTAETIYVSLRSVAAVRLLINQASLGSSGFSGMLERRVSIDRVVDGESTKRRRTHLRLCVSGCMIPGFACDSNLSLSMQVLAISDPLHLNESQHGRRIKYTDDDCVDKVANFEIDSVTR